MKLLPRQRSALATQNTLFISGLKHLPLHLYTAAAVSVTMAVAFKQCALLAVLALAAIVDARPQENAQTESSSKPYPAKMNCPHARLIAGMEAKSAELPEISTFLKAISISGLLNGVFAYHCYTMLAPTNEAFMQLATSMGLSSVDELLVEGQKEFLTELIRFHFGVGAARYTKELQEGSTTMSVFAPDQSLQASTTDGQVTFMGPINQAAVLKPDIALCNSVMHVVDAVIVPAGHEHVMHSVADKAAARTAEL